MQEMVNITFFHKVSPLDHDRRSKGNQDQEVLSIPELTPVWLKRKQGNI